MADVRTPELVINKLSKQQYDNIQNPSATELYLVPEDEEHKPICYPTTVSEVRTTSMVVKSSVSDNGKILTENGFVYNTSGNPTISDNKVICDLGVGQFEKKLENLTMNTEYHIKSYGQNSSGLVYGSELVQRTVNNPIPLEYQLVEYLQSSGSQYIDTGIIFPRGFTIKTKIMHTSLTTYNTYIGAYESTLHNIIRMKNTGINPCIGTNSNTVVAAQFSINRYEEFICSNYDNKVYYQDNGSTYPSTVVSGIYPNLRAFIFTLNFENGINTSHSFVGRMCYIKIVYDDNHTINNPNIALYPVYRIADNKPGMYDIVNGVFYTNQGTGEFVVGPDAVWSE